MNANLRYEIKAEAFRRMTGRMAPGKDEPLAWSHPYAERAAAWSEWHAKHGECAEAMLCAMEAITEGEP